MAMTIEQWWTSTFPTLLFRIRCLMETSRETEALSRVRPYSMRHARWSMCKTSSAPDPRFCPRRCYSPPYPRFSANVRPRIFMVASQGLGFEEIRSVCNALLTPNPFLARRMGA